MKTTKQKEKIMSYELRAVPRDWVHPEGKALYAGHEYGEHVKYEAENGLYEPNPADYMSDWLPEEAPCLQWYETVSRGTPISPVFEIEAEAQEWMDAGADTALVNWVYKPRIQTETSDFQRQADHLRCIK